MGEGQAICRKRTPSKESLTQPPSLQDSKNTSPLSPSAIFLAGLSALLLAGVSV
jgi:hypothetical protein